MNIVNGKREISDCTEAGLYPYNSKGSLGVEYRSRWHGSTTGARYRNPEMSWEDWINLEDQIWFLKELEKKFSEASFNFEDSFCNFVQVKKGIVIRCN